MIYFCHSMITIRTCFLFCFLRAFVLSGQLLPGSGNALDLRTTSGYVEIPNFGQIGPPITFMAWIYYVPGAATQCIFSSDNTLEVGYHGFWLNVTTTHQLQINTGSSGCYSPACRRALLTTIPAHLHNKWIHIAATLTGIQSGSIYINGISMPTTNQGTGNLVMAQTNSPTAQVGTAFEQGVQRIFWEGKIDELSVWNRALSQAEVREYMCKKVPPSTPNLYAYYKFDEPNANGPLIDSSPNGRDGAHVNGGGRVLSGAYIGDESGYTYSPAAGLNWTNSSGETIDVSGISNNVNGVHAFTVNEDPNHKNGVSGNLDCVPPRYHGVFFVPDNAATPSADISISGNAPFGDVWRRDGNDANTWSAINNAQASGNSIDFSVSNNSELIAETGAIAIDTTVRLCPGQSFSIGGNTYTQPGNHTVMSGSGQGCDTVYDLEILLGEDDIEVDTTIVLCEGQTLNWGGNAFTQAGQYDFTIMDENGCDSVISLEIIEGADSILEIQPFDEVICVGQEATVRVFPMNPGLLSWSNNQTGASTTITEGGYYAVTFQGQCGEQVDSIFVEDRDCTPRVFIPSAFTPNGDGVNDRFEVKGDGISDYSIRIYSRWGSEVFYSTSMANAWDGTINGEPAPTGVYVYVVTIKGFQLSRVMVERGSLMLMR